LLVHPSLEESFGNTLVEAMAQWTPVVGGEASGAVPWVLDGGKAGLLTDVTEPASLATSIRRILNSKELWLSYSEAGYKRAHSTFQLSQIIDRYIEVYEEMITPAR
jgi:glycosyltransferase involved in cell wall biosynthesis